MQNTEPFLFRLGHRPSLDGLRGVSILVVLFVHLQLFDPKLKYFFRGGLLGVDMFFVISGFLITSLLLSEYQETGRISLRDFYIRRGLRLLPALASVVGFSLLLGLWIGSFEFVGLTPFRLLSIAAYFMNWVRAFEVPQSWFLGHFWSLSVEEQFYIVWPTCLLLLLWRGVSRQTLITILVVAAVASFSAKAFLFLSGASQQRLVFGSDTRAEPVIIGCLLAVCLHWNVIPRSVDHGVRVLSWVGCLVGFGFVVLADQTMGVLYFGGFTVFALSVAAVMYRVVIDQSSRMALFFSSSALVWLGKRSYGIYLWHWPIFKIVKAFGLGPNVSIVVSIVVLIVVAAASFRFLETPFLTIKSRFASSTTGLTQVPSPVTKQVVQSAAWNNDALACPSRIRS